MNCLSFFSVFSEGEECSWIDRVDSRYGWLKKHLMEFEERLGKMFPDHWEMSERISVEFCSLTCRDLEKAMFKRQHEIDTKLLLHAVQRTAHFESLLSRRFTGITLMNNEEIEVKEETSKNPFEEELDKDNPFFEDGTPEDASGSNEGSKAKAEEVTFSVPNLNPFHGIISKCFEPYLHIYIKSQDQNLDDLLVRAAQEQRNKGYTNLAVEGSSVLHSCGDLFMFYKKCMVQCAQLVSQRISFVLSILD